MSQLQNHVKGNIGSEKSFGFVFTAVFALIALWPLTSGERPRIWAIVISCLFLVLAIIAPKVLVRLNKVWYKFGLLLGAIINPIVMSLIFFLVIIPIGLIMKSSGNDILRQKLDKSMTSYWIKRDSPIGSMKDQF
jgi:hypothetical protein